MRNQRRRFSEGKREEPQAWRIVWFDRERFGGGRYSYRERVEYAESESLAVNQALAKIRHDYPAGCVVSCHRLPVEPPAAE